MEINSTTEKVTEFLNLLMKRDLANIVNLFADVVDWYIPGNTKLAPWT